MDAGRISLKDRRVCIVSFCFYPSDLDVRREAEALVRNGCDVSVICLREEGKPFRRRLGSVKIYQLPVKRRWGGIGRYLFEYNFFFLLSSLGLLYLHSKKRFDAVQVNAAPDYLVFVALIPRLTGAKVILCLREPVLEHFEAVIRSWYGRVLVPLIKLSEKLSIRFADRVLTGSRVMRDNFGKKRIDVNKINVVVSVPENSFSKMDRLGDLSEKIIDVKKEERRKGIFRILCLGSPDEMYGHDTVVKAIACLKQRLPGVQFRFSGEGDFLGRIDELAKALKVDSQVASLGFADSEKILEEILAADAGIIPVKKNPYSVLVLWPEMYEFIALGRPVIASRLDSINSYFPEDSFIYFEPGDERDLADKIYYVFAHPEVLEHRLKVAREIHGTYDWEREEKKYINVYQRLLAGDGIS